MPLAENKCPRYFTFVNPVVHFHLIMLIQLEKDVQLVCVSVYCVLEVFVSESKDHQGK